MKTIIETISFFFVFVYIHCSHHQCQVLWTVRTLAYDHAT